MPRVGSARAFMPVAGWDNDARNQLMETAAGREKGKNPARKTFCFLPGGVGFIESFTISAYADAGICLLHILMSAARYEENSLRKTQDI